MEGIARSIAVGLSKGESVCRRNGVGVFFESPVLRAAAYVAYFDPRIPPEFALDAHVKLESIGGRITGSLANPGNSQSRAKAIWIAGGKLVGVIQEAAVS